MSKRSRTEPPLGIDTVDGDDWEEIDDDWGRVYDDGVDSYVTVPRESSRGRRQHGGTL